MPVALVSLLFVLLLSFAGLLWYSFPHWLDAIGPKGEIVYNLIPELLMAIVEVGVILVLIRYLDEKRWRATREAIKGVMTTDAIQVAIPLRNFLTALEIKLQGGRLYGKQLDKYYSDLLKELTKKSASERLQTLQAAFTPELASAAATYFEARWKLDNCLQDLDRKRFWELMIANNYENDTPERLAKNYTYDQLFNAYWTSQHIRTILHTVPVELFKDGDEFLRLHGPRFGEIAKLKQAYEIREIMDNAELATGEQV